MNAPLNLKELEQKAFRSFYQDGIWDIFFGLMMFAMYSFTFFDQIENKALRILSMPDQSMPFDLHVVVQCKIDQLVRRRQRPFGSAFIPGICIFPAIFAGQDAAAKGDRPVVVGGTAVATGVFERSLMPLDDAIAGPALIEEPGSVTVVPPDWSARLTANDCLVLERNA